MRKISPFIVTIFLIAKINAQTAEPSASVEKNTLQLELESLYSTQNEGVEKTTSWSIPSLLIRYGLTNSVEFQLNTPIIKEQLYNDIHLIHSLYKFDDIQLGFAVNLWKQKNLLPETSLMFRVLIPANFNFNTFGKVLSFNFSHKIGEKFTFTNNIGFVTETNNVTTGFYISNLTYNLSSKLHLFVENFGDFNNTELISTNINIGGGYHLNSAFSIDLSVANGMYHDLFYVGGVLTWAFQTK